MAHTLVARNLRKAFRAPTGAMIEVLRGLSFSVGAGEVVAVVGASGAGKSTLLHVLGGLEATDEGSVRLGEFDIGRATGVELARVRNEMIGFVFQFHHLIPDLTAAENVALPLLISRISPRESLQRASVALERAGLSTRMSHRVGQLSGGEQQMVAVARALIKDPRLVLADEPTGNLDAATGDEIGSMLARYSHEQGAAVIIATHNERLARTCDRVLLLKDGKLDGAGGR